MLQSFSEMGSNESRCCSWSCSHTEKDDVGCKQEPQETEVFLQDTQCDAEEMTVGDSGPLNLDPVVSKPILDFAQKMSEDIITQALQLFWEVEIQYKDLPFIDSGSDYII